MRRSLQPLPRYVINASPTTTLFSHSIQSTFRSRPSSSASSVYRYRLFSTTQIAREHRSPEEKREYYKGQAKEVTELHTRHEEGEKAEIKAGKLEEAIGEAKELQARTPWHREGTDEPPVRRDRSAGAMTKGMAIQKRSTLILFPACWNGRVDVLSKI